ncbi:MAG: DUF4168 domain-containing protein [Venatoribacter sp.]
MQKHLVTTALSATLALGALCTVTAQAEDFTPASLEKFAKVEQKVDDLRIEYIKKAFNAHDEKKASAIEHEAEAKMTKIVEASGLKVAEYNAIASAVIEDPSLRNRIASIH